MSAVKIAQLKAHLSEHVRRAARGEVVTVYDRDRPVAQLVPFRPGAAPVEHRPPLRALAGYVPGPPLAPGFDVVGELLADRDRQR
jgi:prevent-host-death family protein